MAGMMQQRITPCQCIDALHERFFLKVSRIIDRRRKQMRKAKLLGVAVAGAIGVVVLVNLFLPEDLLRDQAGLHERTPERRQIGLAEVTCTMAVERSAHDPSSVAWLRTERQFAFLNSAQDRARSIQPLRAKNAVGALVRNVAECELLKVNDAWQVTKLTVR